MSNPREELEKAYSYEKFLKEFFIHNESGNPLTAYDQLMHLCSGDAKINLKSSDGKTITPTYCKNKFKQYIDWWNNKFADKDKKYLKKEDELLSVESWLIKSGYMNSYKLAQTPRDRYLFGGLSKEILTEKVKRFEQLLNIKPKDNTEKVEEVKSEEMIVEGLDINFINPEIQDNGQPF